VALVLHFQCWTTNLAYSWSESVQCKDLSRREQQELKLAVPQAQRWFIDCQWYWHWHWHRHSESVGGTPTRRQTCGFTIAAQPTQESTMGLSAYLFRTVSSNNSPSAYAALALGGTLCADHGIAHSRR
jgi:hypothetical protein